MQDPIFTHRKITPTTYVIDRNGKIVGEPLLGGITNENSMKQLQENIDTAIANDGK